MLCLTGSLFAQPAANYNIDTDGDGTPEGILYRDVVYPNPASLVAYSDWVPGPGGVTYSTDVELYNGNLTDLRMDIYYCNYGSDTLAAKDKPVVFFFYGGGFVEGVSLRVKDLCIQFAQRGYVAVAPNYRLGFYGAFPEYSTSVCYDLTGPSIAAYRALLDAQAAMRWMRDNAESSLGLDVDETNFYIQGPSYFPMLSHMQSDEVPNSLLPYGVLDDSIKVKASIGRSAALTTPNNYIDAEDKAPLMIFQGTCDKSVPFTKLSVYDRFECSSVISIDSVSDFFLFGSLPIIQSVSHYYEFYPVCGLHHSLKNIEENEMREPMAQFLYKNVADLILPTDPPIRQAYIRAPCDVNNKCTGRDYFNFCNTAIQLPPDNGTCDRIADEDAIDWSDQKSLNNNCISVFPNPSAGPVTLSYRSDITGDVPVQVMDAFGRVRFSTRIAASEGLNANRLVLPSDMEPGIYFIMVDGKPGIRLIRE